MTTRPVFRRLLSFAALCSPLFCAAPCLADRSDEANSIHAGAASIQFLPFGGGSSFSPASSRSGIFLKSHFSDRGALRLGATLSLDESSGKSPPGPIPNGENIRSYAISVSGEIDEYVDSRGPITAFVGVGPYWVRSRSSFEVWRVYTAPDSTVQRSSYKSERKTWEVGATAAMGFEWFFKRKLSVIGRVGASLGFGKRHDKNSSVFESIVYPGSQNQLDSNTATAGTSSAALGLAVYL